MKRTEQREHIFKLIFGADFNEESEQGTQTELYLEQIEGATEKDMQYISQKAQKIIEKIDEIDTLINEHTTGWKTGRMNKVDLTILRLAVYEMKWDEDVPTGVAKMCIRDSFSSKAGNRNMASISVSLLAC